MSSAMVDQPPGPRKLALIRQFLRLTGVQTRIDDGQVITRLGMPGGYLHDRLAQANPQARYGDVIGGRWPQLVQAYEKRRSVWQGEYEHHLNWEFTEAELEAIVAFLASPVGAHYREGLWRMEAYVGTNTEHLVEEIVTEVEATLPTDAPAGRS